MGAITSVYVGTDTRENSGTNETGEESVEKDNALSIVEKSTNSGRNLNQKVVAVQFNHSLNVPAERFLDNSDARRDHMGVTIQYLAEENVRLQLTNKELMRNVERLTRELKNQTTGEYDPDNIYGETTEKRLERLEKHLASERREKWSAIENSERTRVDLVNCERELEKSNKTMETLIKELEMRKAQVLELEKTVESLKAPTPSEQNPEEEEVCTRELGTDRQISMDQFKADLKAKKETRQKALAAISSELNALREELQKEKAEKRRLEQELEIRNENHIDGSIDSLLSDNAALKNEIDILSENVDKLKEFSTENIKLKFEMKRLNEEMDSLNSSLGELKFEYYEEKRKHERTLRKLKELEEEKTAGNDKDGLKALYQKQLDNIKNLKELYEERVRLMEAEKVKLQETLDNRAKTIENQRVEIDTLNKENDQFRDEARNERQEKESMERELRLTISQSKDFENELRLINNMFTQMLLGPYNSGNETDLDKLTELLQENHDLITEMTTKEGSSEIASVLPKLLLDLITQVDGVNDRKYDDLPDSSDTISEQSESALEGNEGAVLPILSYRNATLFKPPEVEPEVKKEEIKAPEEHKHNEQISPAVQEIASNLPKVWKVLMELLSHHSAPEEPTPGDEKQCYKYVETPNGTRAVISVSKTFIRLKDLILEKKALQKELGRLKQLNSHLETRLDDQEKRLSQVQCELHKTWGIVGRMRAQHQQLHNHEKILRYELQEKRVMLSELKQELEYCKEKWEKARQKNDQSETEWKKLRREFAARKSKGYLTSNSNDSGESGFSDEQNESGEENHDADRSSTQSPIDIKLVDMAKEAQPVAQTDALDTKQPDISQEIIKQCENNQRQAIENVEDTKLEECTEVSATAASCSTKVQENTQEDERARAREARDLRLKRLEEQCKLLVRQVDITTHKSNYLNNRLEELHEQYGSPEVGRRQPETSLETNSTASSESTKEALSSSQTDCQTDCHNEQTSKKTTDNKSDD